MLGKPAQEQKDSVRGEKKDQINQKMERPGV